jgi:hypothetical protein
MKRRRSFWDPDGSSFFAFLVAIYRDPIALASALLSIGLFILVLMR